MKFLSFIIACIFALSSLNAATHRLMPKDEVKARQMLINDIYNDQTSLKFTCERVEMLTEGRISQQKCHGKLHSTNKSCELIAKQSSQYFNSQHDVKQLVSILVSCPIATIMGLDYSVSEGSPIIRERR